MDELYENLENYNEETTLAEVRDENKELKLKLEEYASALEKLQKDYDTLCKEHRQLEINFSSLLKTAKAEIERKTQMITKLNIEKDQMVLNSIQNRNGSFHRRRNNQTNNRDMKPTIQPVNSNKNNTKCIENHTSNERTSDNSPKDHFNKPVHTDLPYPPFHSNIQTRLLDMVNKTNSAGDTAMNYTKSEAKENIQHNDAPISSARIRSRRKSMPAFRVDSPRFSPEEDEVGSAASGREITPSEPETTYLSRISTKTNIEKRPGHEPSRDLRKKLNKFGNDKPKSQDRYDTQKYTRHHSPDRRYHPERRGSPDRRRLSPESRKTSAERRRSSPERRMDRRRVSPYKRRDSPERRKLSPDRRRVSPDRRRVSPAKRRRSPETRRLSPDRRRQSPNRRKSSPDRHLKGFRDHSEELRRKQEYDGHRRFVSPAREKYFDQKRQSREVQRPHEVHHPEDYDKYKSYSQERYATKHKMPNDNEEPCKRMRLDSHHQIEERSIAEPEFSNQQHDMSCQSPEFNNFEAHPSHQIREIKFSATTELEDPRRSSDRYSLKLDAGKTVITCVNNENIDLKVIDTSGWNNIKVKMPDALLHRPDSSVLAGNLLQKPVPLQFQFNCGVPINKALETDPCSENSLPEAQAFNSGAILEQATPTPTFNQQKTSPRTEKEPVHKEVTSDMPDILQEHSSHCSEMPYTAPQKSMLTDDIVNEIYMDIDNPKSNLSESGEIYDDLDVPPYEPAENTVEDANDLTKNTKCMKDSQAVGHCKDASLCDIYKEIKTCSKVKQKNITNNLNKQADETNLDATTNENDNNSLRTTSQPCTNDIQKELQNYASSKEIIGDFDMSDDGTSDNTDIQIKKQTNTVLYTEQASVIESTGNIKATSKENESVEPLPNSEGKSNAPPQEKKIKTKKKSHKHKDTQELHEIEDSIPPSHKHGKTIETTSKKEFDDSSRSIDELVKIRDNIIKDLENKETLVSNEKLIKEKETKKSPKNQEPNPPIDKSTIKKEHHSRGLQDKEMPVSNEKSVKKKEVKTKTSPESIKLIPPTDKNVKKKTTKPKETKHKTVTAAKKDIPVADEPLKNKEIKKVPDPKNTNKQRKKKEEVTSAPLSLNNVKDKAKASKFTELFGDSSSLVSPEDLGLVATVIPQDNYVAIFEDAQDATDIASIKAAVTSSTTENDKAEMHTNIKQEINSGDTPVISQGPITPNQESISKELVQSAVPIQSSLYQNLQPEIDADNQNVKTVIISSGIQPQFISEVTESNSVSIDRSEDLHVMQCVKPTVLQGLGMQALATSTPHKLCEQNVQLEMDPSTSKYVSLERKDTSVDKPSVINNSDNTNSSQVNDEPDMKIFVKRRRKVLKKA